MHICYKGLGLILLCWLVFVPRALAHKVTIFAWAEGDTVHTESKFSGGKLVKDGKVEVFAGNGTRLLEGRTDDKGEFSFKAPAISELKIVLTAGMGHKNSWTLSAAELGQGLSAPAGVSPQPQAPAVAPTPSPTDSPEVGPALSAGDVEAIVARQLEQNLQPLTRMLAAQQERGPSISDIVGGIGYIIGLVGLGAYLRYRREGRRP